ncbi:flippase [Natronococcus occultus]|uniref:Membrane protein involved in the export of O-antigen and teichoic acid n=1 Tax=Natronococcus occultus SP4 TaxID=694430 RepID=L0K182_9EURY|nr:flippase [Natronococcus occultus]AGB38756.1 membrane protein involved in the export of O-antigen and teichoic acid [Natronococcus occultus SP4]
MSITNKILSGFRIDLLSRFSKTISGGLLAIVLARLLEPSEYGLLYLSISIFTIATLAGKLGLGKSAARYVTEYIEDDPQQIPHIIETAAIALVITLGAVTIGLIVAREHLVVIFGEPGLEPLLLAGAAYVFASGVVSSGRRICQGFKKINWSAYIMILGAVIRPVVAIGLVLAGFGAVGALTGHVIGSLSAAALAVGFVYYQYSGFERGEIKPGLRRQVAEYAVPISLTQNSDTVIKRVDILLVGAFLTPLAVSYYVVAKQVMTFLKAPATSLGYSLSPRYSEQLRRGNLDTASKLYSDALTGVLLFYIPAMVGLVIVAEPTLTLLFGSEYAGGTVVLQILTVYLIAQAVAYITEGGLDYLGRAKYRAYAKGTTAVTNLLLNIVLIPTIGIVGAAISTASSYAVYVAFNVYLMNLELDLNWRSIGRSCAKITAVTAVMAVAVLPVASTITGLVSLVAVVLFGGLVWLTASILVGLIETQEVRSAVPL